MNPLYLVPALILLALLRARWVTWQLQDYTAKALYYCWRTKQSTQVSAEMSELWPGSHMLVEIWRWDFRHYVVYHDHYDAMMAFTVTELARNDRGWEIFDVKGSEELPGQPGTEKPLGGFELDKQDRSDDDAGSDT